MLRLDNIFIIVCIFLFVVGAVCAVDGSGSVAADDGSPNEDYVYSNNSNDGSLKSDDDDVEDPLDEDYDDDKTEDAGGKGSSNSDGNSNAGNNGVVSLNNYSTGNPLFLLFICMAVIGCFSYYKK